jgi:hypothetical protein
MTIGSHTNATSPIDCICSTTSNGIPGLSAAMRAGYRL